MSGPISLTLHYNAAMQAVLQSLTWQYYSRKQEKRSFTSATFLPPRQRLPRWSLTKGHLTKLLQVCQQWLSLNGEACIGKIGCTCEDDFMLLVDEITGIVRHLYYAAISDLPSQDFGGDVLACDAPNR